MICCVRLLATFLVVVISNFFCFSQVSPAAKNLYQQAIIDTTAHKDSLAAIHFYQAASEEVKVLHPDLSFAGKSYLLAGQYFFYSKDYSKAHGSYYFSLDQYRKAKKPEEIFDVFSHIGTLYDKTRYSNIVYELPESKTMETILAYRPVWTVKNTKDNLAEVVLDGGSNDGIYEGAEGEVYGKHRSDMKDRANTLLGTATITKVSPNSSVAIVKLANPVDSFHRLYVEDMIYIPIRFPKKIKKDIFLEVSLLNIRFVDNARLWLAHPRMLMYYSTPQLEKEVYDFMKHEVLEIYDWIREDTLAAYITPTTAGRFKGKNLLQAMRDTKTEDLKGFLGFVRSFPGKYMGGTWKFSETYATWIINNSPYGSNELMDSLMTAKSDGRMMQFINDNKKDIKDFHERWAVDVQDMANAGNFKEAYQWSSVIQKVAFLLQNDDMIGWSLFNLAKIQDEEKKHDDAIVSYTRAKTYFEKAADLKGQSFCINNIGTIHTSRYQYKESQQSFEQALQLRLKKLLTDTSDQVKIEIARAYSGIASALYNQSKYAEAIEQYKKGIVVLQPLKTLEARKNLAGMCKWTGKSFEKMADYQEAAGYYQREYNLQKALGDVEAQADALDNQGLLTSKLGRYRDAYDLYARSYELHLHSGNKPDAGYSMSNMGQMIWNLGKYDSAIMAHNNALKMRQEVDDKKGQAYSWKKLAGLYRESGNPQKSSEAYKMALGLYKLVDDKEEYAGLLQDMGSDHYTVKDNINAIKYFLEALQVYRTMKLRNKEADVLSSIGNTYYQDKNFAKADENYLQAMAIQKEIKDRSGLMYSYINHALVTQFLHEKYAEAISQMQMATKLAIETNSETNLAYCQQNIGSLYSYLNIYDSAKHYYDQALTMYKKLGDKKGEADMDINYGYYYNYRGDFDAGRESFEKALVIGKEINNNYTIASANSGISTLLYLQGNFNESLDRYRDILKIYQQNDNPWGIASVYVDMGNVRNRQSEFEMAINYYGQADSIYKKLQLTKPQATTVNNIGTIYYHQGNYEKAMDQFRQTMSLLQVHNDDPSFMALLKGNFGEVYLEQKKYIDADKWLGESLAMAKKQNNFRQVYQTSLVLARLKTITKDIKTAEEHFRVADTMIRRTGEKTAMIELLATWAQLLYDDNRVEIAEQKLQESIRLSKETGFKNFLWKAHSTLGDIKIKQGKNDEAIEHLKTAIAVVEEIKSKLTGGEEAKKIFASGESIVGLYQKMVVYLKKLGRVEDALVYMEKANTENVKLRMNAGDLTHADAATNEAVSKEKELRSKEATYEKEILEEKSKPENLQHKEKIGKLEEMRSIASNQYKAYVKDLKTRYPNLQAFKTVDPDEFMEQRRRIPSDVAVISYLVTEKEISLFVVMKDTIFIKDIPIDRKRLEDKISAFYKLNARTSLTSADERRGGKVGADKTRSATADENRHELAAELYDILVAPVMPAIATKARVALVPSGFLSFIPFDALVHQVSGKPIYFGEEKQLFYVNKISTVTNGGEQMGEMKMVAVGNADKSLKHAETEVNLLHAKYTSSVLYVREQATRKNVLEKQGGFNVLHLATHGILDYTNASNSYLVLASDPSTGDDGKLTISQIQEMTDIDHFRLITLSACETAVIREVAEGWPISTASAFIEMGVSTVIATLWQVDDKATSLLMEKFYDNMKTMDKVAALQNAQLFLSRKQGYSDPYYWAPFQLVGFWK